MAPTSSALVLKDESGSPFALNKDQVLKASSSLLKHIKTTTADKSTNSEKKNLLEDADHSKDIDAETAPIWLSITTKIHISAAKRLKPYKLSLPNPFIYPPSSTICLITADPQRTYKDIVFATDSPIPFPELQGGNVKITRVIDVTKLKAKYDRYEAQRQLLNEHDIFLADDRIITRLPQILGKTFYKSSTKRPIPVSLSAEKPKENGKRIPSTKNQGSSAARKESSPASKAREAKAMHTEIEKTLNSALLSLSPSTNTSIRIGYASWTPAQISENITSVCEQVISKHVPKNWQNVRSIHIKGPETIAFPIWLASELWVEETMVLEDKVEEMKSLEGGAISGGKAVKKSKKRKGVLSGQALREELEPDAKKQKALPEGDDGNLDKEIALRKEKLRKQKEDAAKEVEEDVSVSEVKSKSKGGKVKKSKSMDVLVGA